MKCIFCNKDAGKYGHNSEPIIRGRCCKECNERVVIPFRIRAWLRREELNKIKEMLSEIK